MKAYKLVTAALMLLAIDAVSFSQTGTMAKIGNQQWMTGNLELTVFRNGEAIPEAKTGKEWTEAGKQGKPAWCYYQNDPINGKTYGKLYNWYAINDRRGIVPAGWHLPSAAEWQTLIDSSGGGEHAGGNLKETGTSHWKSPNTGAANENGFSALPSGYCDNAGRFFTQGYYATFWTATECGPFSAWGRHLSRGDTKVYLNCISKSFGFSVRCIKD
jgi:uncharacterized protein (TIGR02145 family)